MAEMRAIRWVAVLVAIVAAGAGVPALSGAKIHVRAYTAGIVGALPLIRMQEADLLGAEADLEVIVSPDHQRGLSLLTSGEVDLLITAVNVGALAHNKGLELQLMNVNIWGIDYLLTYGFRADNWQDLTERTLSLPLKGGPLDFLVRYLARKSGTDVDDLMVVYRPLPQGAIYFQTGKLDAIVIPEPLVSVTLQKTPDAVLSMDIQEEWATFHGGDRRIPFVGLFVSSHFVREHAELAGEVSRLYLEGAEWVNQYPDDASVMAEEWLKLPAPIFKTSLTRTDFQAVPAQLVKDNVCGYLEEILEMYPDLVGGKVPDETFFY